MFSFPKENSNLNSILVTFIFTINNLRGRNLCFSLWFWKIQSMVDWFSLFEQNIIAMDEYAKKAVHFMVDRR